MSTVYFKYLAVRIDFCHSHRIENTFQAVSMQLLLFDLEKRVTLFKGTKFVL